jgi:hypothetical protein
MPRGSGGLSSSGRSAGATQTERSAVGACRIRKRRGVNVGRVAVNNHRQTVDSSHGFRLSRPSPYFEIACSSWPHHQGLSARGGGRVASAWSPPKF